jgi:hypothetical protein
LAARLLRLAGLLCRVAGPKRGVGLFEGVGSGWFGRLRGQQCSSKREADEQDET